MKQRCKSRLYSDKCLTVLKGFDGNLLVAFKKVIHIREARNVFPTFQDNRAVCTKIGCIQWQEKNYCNSGALFIRSADWKEASKFLGTPNTALEGHKNQTKLSTITRFQQGSCLEIITYCVSLFTLKKIAFESSNRPVIVFPTTLTEDETWTSNGSAKCVRINNLI